MSLVSKREQVCKANGVPLQLLSSQGHSQHELCGLSGSVRYGEGTPHKAASSLFTAIRSNGLEGPRSETGTAAVPVSDLSMESFLLPFGHQHHLCSLTVCLLQGV